MPRRSVTAVVTATLVLSVLSGLSGPHAGAQSYRALVFTKTAAFRHPSIDEAVAALQALAAERGFEMVHTEDAAAFSDPNLAGFDVVVFLLTTGDVLDAAQEAALQRFIRNGGGFAGVHAAADTEHGWPWYADLLGARFVTHPAPQAAVVRVEDRRHGSTGHLPASWGWVDEWYEFDRNPRRRVHVLATVSEATYDGGSMGSDHPVAWCHRFEGGRSWYTALGHPEESYADPAFRAHLAGGLAWAAGAAPGNCSPRSDREVLSIDADQDVLGGEVFADRRVCRRGRVIEILRVRPGRDRAVGRARSNGRGEWRRGGFEGSTAAFRAVAPADRPCRKLRSGAVSAA
ncbi:MAG TPA: ThuA domain-containing protein [Actinomycetota bacterium]|nr:ThuA domain-containing protein [Actinomycetota bacterium]